MHNGTLFHMAREWLWALADFRSPALQAFVLGFAPDDLPFAAYEVKRPEHTLQGLLDSGRLPGGQEILTSSDAHTLESIADHPRTLPENSCLWPLLAKCTV